MNNITFIIPIHKYNEKHKTLITNAINSIYEQIDHSTNFDVSLVIPKNIKEKISNIIEKNKYKPKIILNDGDTSYQNQVNFAVSKIETNYFSVVEFDDEISNTYLKNAEEHIKSYPDVDIFLTLIIETNDNNEGLKLTNELVWSIQGVGEVGELGFLNDTTLKQQSDFKLSGALIKTESFNKIGKYKTKIKHTFMYEFLLRALNNNLKILTIPKVLYKHYATRKDSITEDIINNISIKEKRFWYDTANKEFNFNDDRDIDIKILDEV